jgi:hypothetical protein
MKLYLIVLVWVLISITIQAQEKEQGTAAEFEQQLENLALQTEADTEDDSYLQQLDYLRQHPLNLNEAGADELKELQLLTDLQISCFLQYRSLLGKLISEYELQAVPGWDLITIHRLLPFIQINRNVTIIERLWQRMTGGETSLLFRFAQILEIAKGFEEKYYLGSPLRFLMRYRYQYKNVLQYGITGDKDAGEQFFRGAQSKGFDFYSFHFFARRLGFIKALAIGDFTVNLGQGLIQWQSLAFKKSAAVLTIKRQGPVLRPYSAAGEFNFNRGIGITVQRQHWEATVFASRRKTDANLVGADTLMGEDETIAALQTSGYHRTMAELQHRNRVQTDAAGGNIRFGNHRGHIGFNTVQYRLSSPFQLPPEPYDRYAITGSNWGNYSIDYSYTFRNLHIYGEAAADKKNNKAWLNGLLVSVSAKVDLALVYRRIPAGYQSLFGNAFTENALPANENGFYVGMVVRPVYGWQLNAYADFYSFPWLKYRVDAPSGGCEYLVQLTHTPNKQVEMYSRYRSERKLANVFNTGLSTRPVAQIERQNWRTQLVFRASRIWSFQNRVEMVWYSSNNKTIKENGFSGQVDITYSGVKDFLTANARIQYFETDSYDSRIYVYEKDVLYGFSIPVFFEKGFRYYINIKNNISSFLPRRYRKKYNCVLWWRWAQSLFAHEKMIGSGWDAISGNRKTECKVQVMLSTR